MQVVIFNWNRLCSTKPAVHASPCNVLLCGPLCRSYPH